MSTSPKTAARRPRAPQFMEVYPWTAQWLWRRRARIRFICGVLSALGIMIAIVSTLTPNGDFSPKPWLPEWLRIWANSHGEVRNIPAYFLLAVPTFVALSYRYIRLSMTALFAGAALIEIAQTLVPRRTFDVVDIILSWLGIVLAWMFLRSCRRRFLLPIVVRRPRSP